MSRNAVETVMGAVVLLVAGGFLTFAYKSAGIAQASDGYSVIAEFDNIGGVTTGSDVRIGGVKVGAVTGSSLDPQTYRARISMRLGSEIRIPVDSSASISSDGLLGGKFVAIAPGGDDKNMEDGGSIKITQSSVSIEELIGKFIFSGGGADSSKKRDDTGDSAPGGKL